MLYSILWKKESLSNLLENSQADKTIIEKIYGIRSIKHKLHG